MLRRCEWSTSAAFQGYPTVALPGAYGDSTISVDARLVGETRRRQVVVYCRSGYALGIEPDARAFFLFRREGGVNHTLADWQPSPAIHSGHETNRVELTCVGTTISASINGTIVASVEDDTFQTGAHYLQAGGPGLTAQARFDNLRVTQR